MGVTLQEALALRTESAYDDFDGLVLRTRPDRLQWRPEGAKSVLDLVRECSEVNERWASILRTGRWVGYDACRDYNALMPTLATARAHLRATSQLYVAEIRAFPTERLDTPILLPWGEVNGAAALMHGMWHMSYHAGQVAYIQTMYGDFSD